MKQVNYILVHETACKNTGCDITYRDVPHLGYCVVCDASSKLQVSGSKERTKLLDELVRLRLKWPEAPILGESEVDTSGSYAPVQVNPAMNELRRELSDLP